MGVMQGCKGMVRDMGLGNRRNFPEASHLISIQEVAWAMGAMIIAIVTTTKELAKSLPLLLHGKNQIYPTVLLQIYEMVLTLLKPSSFSYRNFHCDCDKKW
jgi:hypothetical protein